jgi:hypothetical protein
MNAIKNSFTKEINNLKTDVYGLKENTSDFCI